MAPAGILMLLVVTSFPQVSQSLEICCCPDLTLSLSAVESDTTMKLHNGFLFGTKTGSTVTLTCQLGDKDHQAIKSVEYMFHKTNTLADVPISESGSKVEVCVGENVPTCELESVQHSDQNSGSSDNAVYQCLAMVTLHDDAVVTLWSHTIKLDVYYPPTIVLGPVNEVKKNVSVQQDYEKLYCTLPESSPKTMARWYFMHKNSAEYRLIDIPNDELRGSRHIIVEDETSVSSIDDVQRGMLLLILYDNEQDQGHYKCKGVYETPFGGDTYQTFDISFYDLYGIEITWKPLAGFELQVVTEIAEPKMVNQNSSISFTVRVRDVGTNFRVGELRYLWKIYQNGIGEDINVEDYPNLSVSNVRQTLMVTDLVEHVNHEFECVISRDIEYFGSNITLMVTSSKFKLGNATITPWTLSVPLTSRTCIKHGEDLMAAPNRAYMMPSAELATLNYHQILLNAEKYKFLINKLEVSFDTQTARFFKNETGAGITQNLIQKEEKAGDENTRCVYWQYMRAYAGQYQLFEVIKTERFRSGNISEIDFSSICQNAHIIKDVEQRNVTLRFPSNASIKTAQCLKAELLEDGNSPFRWMWLRSQAPESCATWNLPATFEFTDIPRDKMDGMELKISSGSCGNAMQSSCTVGNYNPTPIPSFTPVFLQNHKPSTKYIGTPFLYTTHYTGYPSLQINV